MMSTLLTDSEADEDPNWGAAMVVGILLGLVSAALPSLDLYLTLVMGAHPGEIAIKGEQYIDVVILLIALLAEAGLLIALAAIPLLRRRSQRARRWCFALFAPVLPWLGMWATFLIHFN